MCYAFYDEKGLLRTPVGSMINSAMLKRVAIIARNTAIIV
jgi:hypothetical protein